MTTVTIARGRVWVDAQPVSLLSGEVHYWRLAPASWRPVLQRVKALGLEVIATYVCWDFHEIAPGQFDFTGQTDPRRNLIGFLDLLTAEGFWIILRPGPYIYSEWSNNGVPDDAARYHRLDPTYLALAERYMAAVTAAARPYLATQGGRIILWQADNEIDPWPQFYAEPLGLGQRSGPFQDYLQERYGDVAALNTAWNSDYRTFGEARAVTTTPWADDPALQARYHDYRAFLHWYVNRAATWAVETYRSLGVDVPILLNAYSGTGVQRWADLEAIGDLAGPDIYPSREFALRHQEHRHLLEAVRYTRTYSSLPYIPEFEAGIWHDWLADVGALPPNHYRLMALSALLAGAAGWNWYMLVNRDNWTQSPINEWGRTRPDLFAAFRQITDLYRAIDPPRLVKQTHTAVTFDPLQRGTERPGHALLHSLYEADIDYEFWDVSRASTASPLALYAGGPWLAREGQQQLVNYVESGGHLICVGAYPRYDEHLRPLNLLDIPAPEGIVNGNAANLRLSLLDDHTVESPWAGYYTTVPGQPISAERLPLVNLTSEELALQFNLQAGTRYIVGFTQARAQGRLTVLHVQPTPELLLALHRWAGVPLACRSRTRGVNTAIFRRDGEIILIAVNAGNEDKAAEIDLEPGLLAEGRWLIENLETGQQFTIDIPAAGPLSVNLPRKDGVALHFRHLA